MNYKKLINESNLNPQERHKIAILLDKYYKKFNGDLEKTYNQIFKETGISKWKISDLDKEDRITDDIELDGK